VKSDNNVPVEAPGPPAEQTGHNSDLFPVQLA